MSTNVISVTSLWQAPLAGSLSGDTQKRRTVLRIGRQSSALSAQCQGQRCLHSSKPHYDNCDREPEPFGAGSNTSRLLGRPGREIPSFCILWISVVRFKPSLAAAPFGPPITQPTPSSVRRISACSESLKVVAAGEMTTAGVPAVGKGLGSTPSLERIT